MGNEEYLKLVHAINELSKVIKDQKVLLTDLTVRVSILENYRHQ